MPKLNLDALAFALAWAALAVAGGVYGGWALGAALSVGLLVVIMPVSAMVLSKTGDFRLERNLRWGLLLAGTMALLAYRALAG